MKLILSPTCALHVVMFLLFLHHLDATVNEVCSKPNTYSWVRDKTGRQLCAVATPDWTKSGQVTLLECVTYCGEVLAGCACAVYSYYSSGRCDVFSTAPGNYRRTAGCVSYRTDEKKYNPPMKPGDCNTTILSSGYTDTGSFPQNGSYPPYPGIYMNGINVLPYDALGLYTAILNLESCTASSPMFFATEVDPSATQAFVTYVNQVSQQFPDIILAGYSYNTLSWIGPTGGACCGFQGAYQTIINLGGPDLGSLRFTDWWKIAFIVQPGYPLKTLFPVLPYYGAHLTLNATMWGSSLNDVIFPAVNAVF